MKAQATIVCTLLLSCALAACGSKNKAAVRDATTTENSAATSGGSGGTTGEAGAPNVPGGGQGGEAGAVPTEPEPSDGSLFSVNYQLASDVEPDAPGTVGIVTWSLQGVSVDSASIEFGLDTAYGMRAPVDLAEDGYRTLLLGMKPSRSYHFRIVASADGRTYSSDDYTIETGPAPTDFSVVQDFELIDEAAYEPGFIVSSSWQGVSIAFILDADGDMVWWYRGRRDGIARARMSEDGKNMWLIGSSGLGVPLERVSLDTLDRQLYPETRGSHDITPVEGSLMAYIDFGEGDCDSIFEIDPEGNVAEVFESSGYLDGEGMRGEGRCHGNALRYSKTEDVYVMTDLNQEVFIVDRAGEIQWRMSEVLPGGIADLGGRQHGQHLLGDSLLIMANTWGGEEVSMVLEYDLDGNELWRYDGEEFSAVLSDVQRLPGGNTQVTYSNANIVRQIDTSGATIMQVAGSEGRLGYAVWRDQLYGPPPDILR